MATERKYTIMPSGGDYTTTVAWEAAQQDDLVTDDVYSVGEISGDWSGTAETTLTIDGFTTDATRYVELRAITTARHLGIYSTAYHRFASGTAGEHGVVISDDYVRLVGLQINRSSTSSQVGVQATANTGTRVIDCIIYKSASGGSSAYGITPGGSGTELIVVNTQFRGPWVRSINDASGSGVYASIYNCTFIDVARGSYVSNTTNRRTNIKNCLFSGSTTADCVLTLAQMGTGCNYNATTRSSLYASGGDAANDRVSQTFTFVASGSGDYHLASSDAGAKDFGQDLSGDATYPFSTDVDGGTRSGSWDIGFDEYLAGGAITGTTAGAGTFSGALSARGALAAATAGAATFTGALSARGAMSGTVAGAATATAALTGRGALAGSTAGAATFTADLTGTGPGAGSSGSFAGVATFTAVLGARGALAGSTAGVASFAGSILGIAGVVGSFAGAATITGTMQARASASGAWIGQASFSSALTGVGHVSGTFSGSCSFTLASGEVVIPPTWITVDRRTGIISARRATASILTTRATASILS